MILVPTKTSGLVLWMASEYNNSRVTKNSKFPTRWMMSCYVIMFAVFIFFATITSDDAQDTGRFLKPNIRISAWKVPIRPAN